MRTGSSLAIVIPAYFVKEQNLQPDMELTVNLAEIVDDNAPRNE